MGLAGKYQLVSNERVVDYLAAIGIHHSDTVSKVLAVKPVLDVGQDGDDVKMVSHLGDDMQFAINFTFGKWTKWATPSGVHYDVKIHKLGNKYVGSYDYNGYKGDVTFDVSSDSLVQTLAQGNIKCKKTYKRI